MSKELPLVEITWSDHSSFDAGWNTLEAIQALEPVTVRSVGFVAKDEPNYVVLVAHLTSAGSATGEMCILKSDIVSRKDLNGPPARRKP